MCSGAVTASHTFSTGADTWMLRRTVNRSSSMTETGLAVMLMMMVPPRDRCNRKVALFATTELHIVGNRATIELQSKSDPERSETRDVLAEHEGVHLVRALIGAHRLEVVR